MSRPEWIKCIRQTRVEHKGKTWCGRQLSDFDWAFVDVDHAANNGANGGRLVACPQCVEAAAKALRSPNP